MSFIRSIGRLRRPPSDPPEWIVAGLGNPGGQYARTRHNVGFMCANRLAQRTGVRFRFSGKDRADIADASLGESTVLLAEPQTYMNESGRALARLCRRLEIRPDRVLLLYDEVDLPFGVVRIRPGGSAGGHRGAQSVIDELKTSEFPRVRIGIGRDTGPTRDHVLSEFTPEQRRQLNALCDLVADAVTVIVREGLTTAMNRFNGASVETAQLQ